MKRLLFMILPLAMIVGCSDPVDDVEVVTTDAPADRSLKAEDSSQAMESEVPETVALTEEELAEAQDDEEMDVMKVDYVCPRDTNFTVEYSADGETATLYDQADRVFTLTISPAASGAFYKNDDDVSIHTKGDLALVELVKDKTITCTVWKGDETDFEMIRETEEE